MTYTEDFLANLYRMMVRIRVCEESLVEPILNGEICCPCHLYSGQEAIATGICAALKKEDYVLGTHRSHGHFLAKGGSMAAMIAEIYGRETGCSRGRGGSMHLIDPEQGMLGAAPIVAGTISMAMGAALASFINGTNRVAVSFFGDGAAGEGVLYESLNFAALKKLPLIFVCENNFYATHMPIQACRVETSIYEIGNLFCIPAWEVDGNDVLQVFEAGKKAVDHCRQGGGPVFIEALTYRYRGHVGPDDNIQGDHTDIRPRAEIESWLQKDPIKQFGNYLLSHNLLDKKTLAQIDLEAEEEVAQAHLFAKESIMPEGKDLARYVFK